MERPKKIKTEIKVLLKCLGRIYTANGLSVEDALNKIKISGGAKAMSVLTVENNGISKTKILNGAHTNHLFGQGSPTAKEISMKYMRQIFP